MPFIIADRVKETTTTAGTGPLTLAGATIGFRAFSSVCSIADTVYYALQAVDAGGAPTGEWECGLGTYSGVNTLTRSTVTSSSNAAAAVNLSAGTKQVYLSLIASSGAFSGLPAFAWDAASKTLKIRGGVEAYRDDGTQADISSVTYGVNGGGILHGKMANGTEASPTGILSGDIFGGVGSRAYHSGGAFQSSSPTSIHWVASENQTATNYGSYLRILTTPKGSTTRQERVLVTDNGVLWCHGAGVFDPRIETQSKPFAGINILSSSSGAAEGASFASVSYGGSAASGYRGGLCGGTAAAPTATPIDATVCFLGGHAYGATGWSAGTKALISFATSESWTDSAQGMYITFGVTPTGSTTRAEALRIDPSGNILAQQVGRGFRVKEGSNAKQGVATLAAGSVVVSNTSVTTTSRIFLTSQSDGGTPGFVRVSTRSAGVSFTITSSSGSDTSVIAYEIFEPS